ncbi:MAG: hypothetical protein ACOCU4_10520, partial [Alkalispirochaeta sp.]
MKPLPQSTVARWSMLSLLCVTSVAGVWAQTSAPSDAPPDRPAWVHFERAQEAARSGPDRDYAEA